MYVKLVYEAPVLPNAPTFSRVSGNAIRINVTPSSTIAPGHYSGNVTVNVCSDANCAAPLTGSPFQVPYDFNIDAAEGGTTAINLTALSPLAGAADWETFQGNASHTGFVPVTLNASNFSVRWIWLTPADQGKQPIISPITASAGRTFFSTGASYVTRTPHLLHALDEANGMAIWRHDFGDLTSPSVNPPAVSQGKVYIVAGSQESAAMYAFDASSGGQLFRTPITSQWQSYLTPTIFDTTVYTDGGILAGMYGFDKTTGAQQFFSGGLRAFDGWTPAVDANYAYAYIGGGLVTVDRRTGVKQGDIADPTYQWNGSLNTGAPVLGVAGSVTAVNAGYPTQNAIVNFNTAAQTVRWSVKGAYPGNPGYHGGTLFAVNNLPFQLEARSEADGVLLWSWTPPATDLKFVSDVLVTNNLIFVSTAKTTYAIERTSRTVAWSYPASGPLALSPNGILYIQAGPRVHAINLK